MKKILRCKNMIWFKWHDCYSFNFCNLHVYVVSIASQITPMIRNATRRSCPLVKPIICVRFGPWRHSWTSSRGARLPYSATNSVRIPALMSFTKWFASPSWPFCAKTKQSTAWQRCSGLIPGLTTAATRNVKRCFGRPAGKVEVSQTKSSTQYMKLMFSTPHNCILLLLFSRKFIILYFVLDSILYYSYYLSWFIIILSLLYIIVLINALFCTIYYCLLQFIIVDSRWHFQPKERARLYCHFPPRMSVRIFFHTQQQKEHSFRLQIRILISQGHFRLVGCKGLNKRVRSSDRRTAKRIFLKMLWESC